jgi:hypothetical protein
MSCHVSVYLPSLTTANCRDDIGESVQYVSWFADELSTCGVPTRCYEDGNFSDNRDDAAFAATLDRLNQLESHYSAVLQHGADDDENAYHAWLLVQRWVALYHTVIQLRAHGLAADLFGA